MTAERNGKEQVEGGCLCGAVRFVASGAPDRVGVCHCLDCQKHHGSLFFAAAIYPEEAVQIDGEVSQYQGRCFCLTCGSSVFAKSGDEVELHLGALDTPDQFQPDYELWTLRRNPSLPPFPKTSLHQRNRSDD